VVGPTAPTVVEHTPRRAARVDRVRLTLDRDRTGGGKRDILYGVLEAVIAPRHHDAHVLLASGARGKQLPRHTGRTEHETRARLHLIDRDLELAGLHVRAASAERSGQSDPPTERHEGCGAVLAAGLAVEHPHLLRT